MRAVVSGGKERYDSVWNGLKAVRDGMAGEEAKEGYVYIHDGARPFVDEEIIKRAYTCVEENRACVAGMPSKDTVKIVDENQFAVTTPARKYVWNVQTPQVFETALITQAYEKLMQHDRENVTDDAMVVEQEMQIPVKSCAGICELTCIWKNLPMVGSADIKICNRSCRWQVLCINNEK